MTPLARATPAPPSRRRSAWRRLVTCRARITTSSPSSVMARSPAAWRSKRSTTPARCTRISSSSSTTTTRASRIMSARSHAYLGKHADRQDTFAACAMPVKQSLDRVSRRWPGERSRRSHRSQRQRVCAAQQDRRHLRGAWLHLPWPLRWPRHPGDDRGLPQGARQMRRPTLHPGHHAEGPGCDFAEAEPTKFHGPGAYDPLTGEMKKKPASRRSTHDVFGETLVELAQRDPSIVAITAAMAEGTSLYKFQQTFPTASSMSASPSSTPSHSPPAWPVRACARSRRSTPPLCSAPSIR